MVFVLDCILKDQVYIHIKQYTGAQYTGVHKHHTTVHLFIQYVRRIHINNTQSILFIIHTYIHCRNPSRMYMCIKVYTGLWKVLCVYTCCYETTNKGGEISHGETK